MHAAAWTVPRQGLAASYNQLWFLVSHDDKSVSIYRLPGQESACQAAANITCVCSAKNKRRPSSIGGNAGVAQLCGWTMYTHRALSWNDVIARKRDCHFRLQENAGDL